MEDPTPPRSLAPVGVAPAGALGAEVMRAAMLDVKYSAAAAMAKAVDESFSAAARKLARDATSAQIAGGRSTLMQSVASPAFHTGKISQHVDRLTEMAGGGAVAKLAEHTAQASRALQMASGAWMAELVRAAMGPSISVDGSGQMSSLGAAVVKAASDSAIGKAYRYMSAIEEAHRSWLRIEEVHKAWPSASSILGGGPSVGMGVDTVSLMKAVGLSGLAEDVAVRPWVPSQRRVMPVRRVDVPEHEDGLVVVDAGVLDPVESGFAGYRGKTGLALARERLDSALNEVETDPLSVLTPCANLIEAACKTVMTMLGEPATGTERYEELVSKTSTLLGIHPKHRTRGFVVKNLLGAASNIAQQIGLLRNKIDGAGAHGSDVIEQDFNADDAREVVHWTIAWQSRVIERANRRAV